MKILNNVIMLTSCKVKPYHALDPAGPANKEETMYLEVLHLEASRVLRYWILELNHKLMPMVPREKRKQ